MSESNRGGWVYILTKGSDFCRSEDLTDLVWLGEFATIEEAIAHEKRLKRWKIELIEKANPAWDDLYDNLLSLSRSFRHTGQRAGVPRP